MGEHRIPKPSFPERARFPTAEAAHWWLAPVLDAYAILDDGLGVEVPREAARRGEKVACHKGCSECCKNAEVPILPPEIATVSWYVCEELPRTIQVRLVSRLEHHNKSTECPFLLDDSCSIYPVRPLMCRGHHLFGQPCVPNEDIVQSRRGDVCMQSAALSRKVGLRILDAMEWPNRNAKVRAFEAGIMVNLAKQIHQFDWRICATNLKRFIDTGPMPLQT
jgi:Fe-S-cluster containining protein